MVSIGLLNEHIEVEDARDGKYITLYPVSDAPMEVVWGNRYTVVVARQPGGMWRATVPLLHRSGEGNTQMEAERDLVRAVKNYLNERTTFLHDATSLVQRFITIKPEGAVVKLGEGRKLLPVWQVISAMPKVVSAYATSDDTPIINIEHITRTAVALGIPVDTVRAAVAYYLEHKQEIREQLSADALNRVNRAFARLEAESGLSEEDLSSGFDGSPHPHEH